MTAPPLRIREVQIYPLELPLRLSFEHAAAKRNVADPVLVRLDPESPYGELAGWGETLARPYVTGETVDTVIDALGKVFVPRLVDFRARSFAEALEFVDALPNFHADRLVLAARAAVELAVLDLAGKAFGRRATDAAGWVDLPGFGLPGSRETVRYSGIAVGGAPAKLRWALRLQRWYGLRDFKLKVAVAGWEQKLARTAAALKPALRKGNATLRVDANGGWKVAEAEAAAGTLIEHGVTSLEQPLAPQDDEHLRRLMLATDGKLEICADESLKTVADAQRLLRLGVQRFNVRIAKVGGLLPALRIAHTVQQGGGAVQLGCLVGETSLLTAAGAAFMQLCPRLYAAEGAFGTFLLKQDITRKPLRFGRGGKLRLSGGEGLGVDVEQARVDAYTAMQVHPIRL